MKTVLKNPEILASNRIKLDLSFTLELLNLFCVVQSTVFVLFDTIKFDNDLKY